MGEGHSHVVKDSHSSRHYDVQKVLLFVLHIYGGPGGVGGGDKYVGSTGVGGVSVFQLFLCNLNFYFPSINFDQNIGTMEDRTKLKHYRHFQVLSRVYCKMY